MALALSAVQHGATVANHVEVVELLRKPRVTKVGMFGFGKQELCGAILRDTLTGESWTVYAKGIDLVYTCTTKNPINRFNTLGDRNHQCYRSFLRRH